MTLRIADAPTSAPAAEPVTLAECKLDSRIDGTEFDTVIPTLILAARQMCEQQTNRKLVTQTWLVSGEDWPAADDTFSLTPYQSAAVTYWNGSTWATLATDQWTITQRGAGLVLLPAYSVTWPTLGDLVGPRVRIAVTCGYGAASAVPESLKMWIRQHVAAMLRSPDGLADAVKMAPIHYLGGLLDPHQAYG